MTVKTEFKTIATTPFKFDLEKVNPLFSKSKIYVMYHGKNRNMSIISKEAVESSLHTIKNIPIVGEFLEVDGEGNFGSHGGKIEIDDNGMRFIQTTRPIGVIPESAEVYWESIEDDEGIEKEYLVVDGAYLWNRYSDEVNTLKESPYGQSMELEIVDGEWNENEDAYDIKEFTFSAFCILGIDKDGKGYVEPAFEDAKIITYSLDKDKFKNEFSQMLRELDFAILKDSNKEVENNMELEKLLEKYSVSKEELTVKEIDFEKLSVEELEEAIKKEFADDNSDNKDNDNSDDKGKDKDKDNDGTQDNDKFVKSFEMSHDDVRAKLYVQLNDFIRDNSISGDEYDYSIIAVYDNHFIIKNWWTEKDCYKLDYTKNNENIEITGHVEVFEMYLTKEEKDAFDSKSANYDLLVEENEKLKDFKSVAEQSNHEAKVQELYTSLDIEEEDVKDIDVHAFSVEEIEDKCYAILGRKLAKKKNFTKRKEEKSIKLPINNDKNDNDDSPYGDLFSKFKKQ